MFCASIKRATKHNNSCHSLKMLCYIKKKHEHLHLSESPTESFMFQSSQFKLTTKYRKQ